MSTFDTVPLFNVPIVSDQPDWVVTSLGTDPHDDPRRLVFVNAWDVCRLFTVGRKRSHLADGSAIVVAGSSPAAWFIRFGTGRAVPVFDRFHTVVRCLTGAEARNARVFLLGHRVDHLQRIEANFRSTFPALQVAGRSVVAWNSIESVQVGIRKSGSHYVLAGLVGRRSERWLSDNFQTFGPALTVNAFEVFQRMIGETRRLRLWRILRLPAYLVLLVALLIHRIRRRGG